MGSAVTMRAKHFVMADSGLRSSHRQRNVEVQSEILERMHLKEPDQRTCRLHGMPIYQMRVEIPADPFCGASSNWSRSRELLNSGSTLRHLLEGKFAKWNMAD